MPRLTAVRKQALDEIVKRAIFDAAVSVLAEHGVEGMPMDRVATAAGLAKGSLYHDFPGKKAPVEFVYAIVIKAIHQSLQEIIATDRTALEKLGTHLDNLVEHVAKHLSVFKLLFRDDTVQGLLQSTQRRTRDSARQLLAEIYRQGIAEGVFRLSDPVQLAYIFLGICAGVFDSQPELGQRHQREYVRDLIKTAFMNGVSAAQARAG